MVYLSNNSNTSEANSQQLKLSDFPIFRIATVIDPNSPYCGKRGKIVANNYSVDLEIPGVKTPREKQRSIGFKPEQLELNPEPQEWKPPAMPWTNEDKPSGNGRAISFGYTLEQLQSGGKTVTRRDWSSSYASYFVERFKKGLPVPAIDKGFRNGGKIVGSLKLTQEPYPEQLRDMPESDVVAEGFPELSKQEFIDRFFEGDETKVVWVVRFEFEPNGEALPPKEPVFRDAIRKELIEGSGIDPDLYDAAVQFVLDVEPLDGGEVKLAIHEMLGWNQDKFVRFGHQVKPTLEAAAFVNEDGSTWQCKLSHPLLDKDGKIRKYETPSAEIGGGSRAYLPPVPKSLREKIAHRWGVAVPMEGSFWKWVLASKLVPILLTEGGKKTLAALSQGVVAIGFYGCWNGTESKDISGRSTVPELIRDLKPFAVPGRTFYIAMDRDSKPSTVKDVTAATNRLGACLEKAGCSVRVCQWEPKQGKGIDDFIVGGGDVDALLANAPVVSFQGKEWKSKNKRFLKLFEEEFGDRLRFNELTQKVELDNQPCNLEDFFLDIAEQFDMDIGEAKAARLAVRVAKAHSYSPVRNYLDTLPPGDPAFLDTLAERYLGNSDPIAAKLIRYTFVSAVARAYEYGCKHDAITILQGGQGIGKSTFWATLAGEWFTDCLNDANEKDEKLKLRRFWILEFSEFETAYRRKEIEQLKGFLTSTEDSLRVPYGREIETFPRSSIFVGTTNSDEFLRDPSGERRFWIVPVKTQIPIALVRKERDKVWAAARSAYLSGEKRHLATEEIRDLLEYTQQWKEFDPWQEDIERFLDCREQVTMAEILDALGIQTSLRDRKATVRIANILKQLGWNSLRNKSKRFWVKNSVIASPEPENPCQAIVSGVTLQDDTSDLKVSPVSSQPPPEAGDASRVASPPSVTAESPSGQGLQESGDTSDAKNGKTFSEKNLEKTEKQFLPIGTWVRNSKGEIFQCTHHYPDWEGWSRKDGFLVGHLDLSKHQVLEGNFREVNGLAPGSKVRYRAQAIAQIEASRRKYGAKDPFDENWIYEIIWIDPRDLCYLKRLSGGKGKKLIDQMVGCFELAE